MGIFVSHNPRPPPFLLVVEQGFQGGREIHAWGPANPANPAIDIAIGIAIAIAITTAIITIHNDNETTTHTTR